MEHKDNVYSSKEQIEVKYRIADFFNKSTDTTVEKLGSFMKYVTRQDLSILLARFELFKQISEIKGSIVNCGVYFGGELMTWYQLSAALEPINYNRRMIGFDTFSGNASISDKDNQSANAIGIPQPDYAIDSESSLTELSQIHDSNRFLNHIPKIELIRGDIVETVPKYLEENPHLLISLLSLSVNLYEPTLMALKQFLPRMPKGSIIVLATLNEGCFPGVTLSLLHVFRECGLNNVTIKSFPYVPNLSYIVL